MMTKTKSRAALLGAALAISACVSWTGSNSIWEIDYGVLSSGGPFLVLKAPDTVRVGEAVNVTVNTVGSSSCTRAAGVEIAGQGTLNQTLTPLDSVAVRAQACTDDLALHAHPAQLTFREAGTATVRIRGYLEQRDRPALGTVTRYIIVRP